MIGVDVKPLRNCIWDAGTDNSEWFVEKGAEIQCTDLLCI